MKNVFFTLCFLFFPFLIFSQSNEILQILRLQDERAEISKFLPHLNSEDPVIVSRTLEAFGSIQDSNAIPYIIPFLKSPSPNIRVNAAFALGQTGKQSASSSLESALLSEKSFDVSEEISRGFGRTAGLNQIEILPSKISNWKSDYKFHLDFSEILMRASIRQVSSDSLVKFGWWLATHSKSDTVIWKSIYALNRFKKSAAFSSEVGKSANTFDNTKNELIRMNWATLLGNSTDTLFTVEKLGRWLQTEKDSRVRVNLIRSLGKFPTYQSINYLFSAANDETGYVQSAVQSVFINSPVLTKDQDKKDAVLSLVEKRLTKVSDPLSRTDIEWLMLGYKIKPDFKHVLLDQVKNHPNPINRSMFPLYLSLSENYDHLTTLEEMIKTEPMIVKTSALTAWVTLGKKRIIFPKEQVKPVIQYAFSTKDMAMITLASDALKDSVFRYQNFESDLIGLIKTLDFVKDVEAIQSILQTMGETKNPIFIPVLNEFSNNKYSAISNVALESLSQITGKKTAVSVKSSKPDYSDYDWDYLKKWWGGVDVIVQTSKGEFKMRMLTQRAPFTVMSFMHLIEKGFYTNLYFHRVVPNFVVQGGDPRGDGWGGPDYSIRSEFSTIQYSDQGFVGVASAGKDTEGCQLFVVHSPTPHLDGKYTIFAKVISGMDVVQKLEVGDQIKSVAVKK